MVPKAEIFWVGRDDGVVVVVTGDDGPKAEIFWVGRDDGVVVVDERSVDTVVLYAVSLFVT